MKYADSEWLREFADIITNALPDSQNRIWMTVEPAKDVAIRLREIAERLDDAAPDLLAACKLLIRAETDADEGQFQTLIEATEKARVAVAKVEGAREGR